MTEIKGGKMKVIRNRGNEMERQNIKTWEVWRWARETAVIARLADESFLCEEMAFMLTQIIVPIKTIQNVYEWEVNFR